MLCTNLAGIVVVVLLLLFSQTSGVDPRSERVGLLPSSPVPALLIVGRRIQPCPPLRLASLRLASGFLRLASGFTYPKDFDDLPLA